MRNFLIILALNVATACQSIIMSGAQEGVMAVAEDRSVGQVIDDATIYTNINHFFLQSDVRDLLPHVHVAVRQGRVLLTGAVDLPETPERAVALAWQAQGVKEVINEMEVLPGSGLISGATDRILDKQVEARLTVTKGVNILNYSVDVVNARVYLLGLVANQDELNRVLQVTRTTKGIREVVSHLRMADYDANQN